MVDRCDEEGKHVGWSDWTSEDGPEAELESRYCYWKSVYLPSLNGVTHRLAAACVGFAELYLNLKKERILTRCDSSYNHNCNLASAC